MSLSMKNQFIMGKILISKLYMKMLKLWKQKVLENKKKEWIRMNC